MSFTSLRSPYFRFARPVNAIAVVSGTVTASATETGIVAGGLTIVITLTNDTWLAAGTGPIGSTANTQAIIDNIDSDLSEATGWNAVVQSALVPATHVVRTSDTVCTITLPACATYNITALETISVAVPGAALTSGIQVFGTPAFTIDLASLSRVNRLMLMGVC